MNVFEAIEKRREITHFKNQAIDQETLERLLNAGYLAPSGNNLPSREFILVTDSAKLVELEQTTPFMPWLKEAAAAIVVTGRPDVSKYWVQDASIACAYIWLAATECGIGSGFGAVYHAQDEEESERRESHVRNAVQIPSDRRVLAILGLGYSSQEPKPKKHLPREEIVYYGSFGKSAP